ncbi:MAG: hypothetical protein GX800_08005, partial [Clostridiaceae bacterium]|nr:hypothetical protein [Clostridiaceae bacterium]
MNHESVILEMLSRIQCLEEQVKLLSEKLSQQANYNESSETTTKLGTKDICKYIKSLINDTQDKDSPFVILKANDIHRNLNLKNRMPMVCNAMKQCMGANDEVLHETPSGYSST